MSADAPVYSVDASALIEMKNVYRFGIVGFRPMWHFIGHLGDEGRVRVVEQARNECHDRVLDDWFALHPAMVMPMSEELNEYVIALNAELEAASLPMVDPESTENRADPFVVALALMIEERPRTNLRGQGQRCCHVISYEGDTMRRGLARIGRVCREYRLGCLRWPDMLQREGWTG
jgi:hypothetical protein